MMTKFSLLTISSSTALLHTGQYLLAIQEIPEIFLTGILCLSVGEEYYRSIYDITNGDDVKEASQALARGADGFAVLIHEDVREEEVRALFEGLGVLRVDMSRWPREIVVETRAGTYRLQKIEEGVYRLRRER